MNRISILAIFSFIWVGLFNDILTIPDSYEQALMAECWMQGQSNSIECSEIFPYFRQPFPSIAIAFISWCSGFVLQPLSLLIVLTYISMSSTPIIAFWGVSRNWNEELGTLIAIALLASPVFCTMGIFVDSKIMVLPWLLLAFFAILELWKDNTPSKWSALVGLLMSIALLIRIETLLTGILFGIILGIQKRRWQEYWLIYGLCILGWITAIWIQTGVLTISPRFWEGHLLPFINHIPLRWNQELFGMGIWNPPMRSIAMEIPVEDYGLPKFEWAMWWHWVQVSIGNLWLPIDWLIIVILGGVSVYQQARNHKSLLIVAMIAPSIVMTLMPQARDIQLSISYTFVLWMMIFVMMWIGIYQYSHKWIPNRNVHRSVLGLLLLHFSMNSPIKMELNNLENHHSSQAIQLWIQENTPNNAQFWSSFETAPVLFRSQRKWSEWPSIWEMQSRFDQSKSPLYAVIWEHDPHSWYGFSTLDAPPKPVAYVYEPGNSWLVLQLK